MATFEGGLAFRALEHTHPNLITSLCCLEPSPCHLGPSPYRDQASKTLSETFPAETSCLFLACGRTFATFQDKVLAASPTR